MDMILEILLETEAIIFHEFSAAKDKTTAAQYKALDDKLKALIEDYAGTNSTAEGIPDTYAEIEYDDIDTAEAYAGCRFDDMNLLRYLER